MDWLGKEAKAQRHDDLKGLVQAIIDYDKCNEDAYEESEKVPNLKSLHTAYRAINPYDNAARALTGAVYSVLMAGENTFKYPRELHHLRDSTNQYNASSFDRINEECNDRRSIISERLDAIDALAELLREKGKSNDVKEVLNPLKTSLTAVRKELTVIQDKLAAIGKKNLTKAVKEAHKGNKENPLPLSEILGLTKSKKKAETTITATAAVNPGTEDLSAKMSEIGELVAEEAPQTDGASADFIAKLQAENAALKKQVAESPGAPKHKSEVNWAIRAAEARDAAKDRNNEQSL